MTVHGAKGLEARWVVVLDGCEPLGRNDPPLLPLAGTSTVCLGLVEREEQDCAATGEARAALLARARQEHNRLLYVAMTRAADRSSWHRSGGHERGERGGLVPDGPGRPGSRLGAGPGSGAALRSRDPVAGRHRDAAPAGDPGRGGSGPHGRAGWLRSPVRRSRRSGPQTRPVPCRRPTARGCRRPAWRMPRRAAGILIHSLLQHLPRIETERRESAGLAFVRARAPACRARRLRHRPLGPAPDRRSRPRPPVRPRRPRRGEPSGRVRAGGAERVVQGRVDRLAVSADTIRIADFKTGRPPAEDEPCPPPKPDRSRSTRSCWARSIRTGRFARC